MTLRIEDRDVEEEDTHCVNCECDLIRVHSECKMCTKHCDCCDCMVHGCQGECRTRPRRGKDEDVISWLERTSNDGNDWSFVCVGEEEINEIALTLKSGDRDVKVENEKMTYCVNCGSKDTEPSESWNNGDLFAAYDMDGDIEYFDNLEMWECLTCEERFFK